MKETQTKLGRALLKSLVQLREEKGEIALADVGAMFMAMAANINPPSDGATGLVGYSSLRGPSNGLPPSILRPLRFPALPETPQSLSKRS